MSALGRILQVVGWLWVIAGIAGPIFGFSGFSFLPGIIVLFIGRIIRNQGVQKEMPELGGQKEEHRPVSQNTRSTERPRMTPPRVPEPPATEPAAETGETPELTPPPRKRNEMLEQIVIAGREAAAEEMSPSGPDDEVEPGEGEEMRRPMSSSEMIARAHRRWDSKRR